MSNNLLKRRFVTFHDDTRVIDNNELLAKRLEGAAQEQQTDWENEEEVCPENNQEDGFVSGLSAEELEGIVQDGEDAAAVIKAEPQAPVYEGPSPEELLEEARVQIEEMKAAAQEEIEAARQSAIEDGRMEGQKEGRDQGYQDGMAKAEAQVTKRRNELEEEYRERIAELEPEFIKHLTGIYEHIFHVGLGDYHNIVIHLLSGCIQKIEGSKNYIVHISTEDYPYVSLQKNLLLDEMGSRSASLEIIEDMTLKKNECMVETENGIFDCSLDVQLDNLKRELVLLSYENE